MRRKSKKNEKSFNITIIFQEANCQNLKVEKKPSKQILDGFLIPYHFRLNRVLIQNS